MTVTPFTEPETLPLPNLPLLNKVRDHIGAHPETWNQRHWRTVTDCGTSYCFAGWAAYFDGAVWANSVTENDLLFGDTAARWARDALGLTDMEAAWLFTASNRLDDIDDCLTTIYARAGESNG